MATSRFAVVNKSPIFVAYEQINISSVSSLYTLKLNRQLELVAMSQLLVHQPGPQDQNQGFHLRTHLARSLRIKRVSKLFTWRGWLRYYETVKSYKYRDTRIKATPPLREETSETAVTSLAIAGRFSWQN